MQAEKLENQTTANTRLRAIVETCQRCGSSNLLTHEREFSNGTHHIELRCINGHYIKFLPQNKPLLTMPFGMHRDGVDLLLNFITEVHRHEKQSTLSD